MASADVDLIPYTERSNELTENIDIANPELIFDLLHISNVETFKGNSDPLCNGILNRECIEKCSLIAQAIVANIFTESSTSKIILSGCGTSGRIGFMVVRAFNKILREHSLPQYYDYMIAGSDRSLFLSQEAKEDEWDVAASELATATKDLSRVVYIGITCGLSAPYVAGQLDYCLHHDNEKCIPVLLGFNPIELARKSVFAGLEKSFHDIAIEMSTGGHGIIVNPVLGAEPITGSSRMKGGTATKIILESIFLAAHIKSGHFHSNLFNKTYTEIIEFFFETIYYQAYEQFSSYKSQVIPLIQSCGDSLNKKTADNEVGHIYYVANGTFGLLGLIDASECPPTFGTDYSTVRGFLDGAYETLGNAECDLEAKFGDFYAISWNRFESLIPYLIASDTVIMLLSEFENFGYIKFILDQLRKSPSSVFGIVKEMPGNTSFQNVVSLIDNCIIIRNSIVPISSTEVLNMPSIDFYEEMILKWILNTVTTGAHILHGKILKNFMIDVQPTNSKLFTRSIDIVKKFSGTSIEISRKALISAIYQTDDPSPFLELDVNSHITRATGIKRVVPTAILIASRNLTLASVQKYLENNPVIRNAISADK